MGRTHKYLIKKCKNSKKHNKKDLCKTKQINRIKRVRKSKKGGKGPEQFKKYPILSKVHIKKPIVKTPRIEKPPIENQLIEKVEDIPASYLFNQAVGHGKNAITNGKNAVVHLFGAAKQGVKGIFKPKPKII